MTIIYFYSKNPEKERKLLCNRIKSMGYHKKTQIEAYGIKPHNNKWNIYFIHDKRNILGFKVTRLTRNNKEELFAYAERMYKTKPIKLERIEQTYVT